MIQIKDLTKTYDNGQEKVHALNKVSFDICDNDFVIILGTKDKRATKYCRNIL